MKNIVIVAHKFVTHPDDELVTYLNKRKYANVLHISHPFYEAPHRKSSYVWYKKGRVYKKKSSHDFSGYPELIIYSKELFYTISWVLSSGITWDKYIGMDGFCASIGNVLRLTGRIKKTVFWAIDFVPDNRFEAGWKNIIYRWINTQNYSASDEMWDLSPRMADARQKYHGVKKSAYKKRLTVPYGMWTKNIKRLSYKKSDMHTAVFMGRLLENQGAQLVIQAIPSLIKKIPDIRLKIIGTGPYEDDLKKLAIKLRVSKYCVFTGKISSHKMVETEIAKSAVGLAPYIKKLDKWTYYADPGKIKTYLACGVPVLLTDLPWNAKEIQKERAGLIVKDNPASIAKGILKLMSPINDSFRQHAAQYSKKFDYEQIFKSLTI